MPIPIPHPKVSPHLIFAENYPLTRENGFPILRIVRSKFLSIQSIRIVDEILLAVHANGGNWPQALKQVNVNADYYVYREKDPVEFLPWDFIDHGVSREFLLEEYRKAMETAKEWKLGR